jgi:hypothetical protein
MSQGVNSKRLVHLGFLTLALLAPCAARAQQPETGARLMAEPAAEPPPAETPPPAAPATAPAAAPKATNPTSTGIVGGDTVAEPPPDAPSEKKKKKKSKADLASESPVFSSAGGAIQLKGRVFALAELTHRSATVVGTSGGLVTRDVNSLDLSLASARFGIEYYSPLPWLSAELELEIAGPNPEVKDAYILAGKRFFAKAGQFKIPAPALELESPWTLPLVRRGLVHDLLTDWLDVAGRRPGLALGYRGKGGLKPRLTIGAFQGTTMEDVVPGDRDVELIEAASMEAQTVAARAEVEVSVVDIGAWYEHRVGSKIIGEFSHFPTFGLDATINHKLASGGLRVWIDGSGGKSLYVNEDKPEQADPLFMAGRALVGYRFGGVVLGDPYLEPFGFFALLDPDTEVVEDFVTEAALGVNAGYWDRARVTLQAEMTNGQRNLPTGFLDNMEPDRMSLLLQAGARF